MRKIIPYNPKLKEFAKKLRNNSTNSEIHLWHYLKGKQLSDYSFHRQKPLLNYIADFYCHHLKLVIELDGYTHQFEQTYKKDNYKQDKLEAIGLTVLRFSDDEVLNQTQGVITVINNYITKFERHTPNPSQEGNV